MTRIPALACVALLLAAPAAAEPQGERQRSLDDDGCRIEAGGDDRHNRERSGALACTARAAAEARAAMLRGAAFEARGSAKSSAARKDGRGRD